MLPPVTLDTFGGLTDLFMTKNSMGRYLILA
jgi:hypothetical protein